MIDATCSIHDFSSEYRFTAALSGSNYLLHWNVDMENEVITFGVNASTTGWVGFGISPNGQMPGSDVVIAWVDENGKVFLQVCTIAIKIIMMFKNFQFYIGSICYRALSTTN